MFTLYHARTTLRNLFQQRALEVCLQAANELYSAIDLVVPRDWNAALRKLQTLGSPEPGLGFGLIYPIRNAAQKFETVLAAELGNSDTYWISPKGTHKTLMLMSYAHMELPSSVVSEIAEVKADFDQAGKCLLFDTPTAAGFHLLRSTEAVIRKYYKIVTGVEPKIKFRNWGAYIKVLKEHNANPKITGFLDHMREHYRNPILHPEENLGPEEAQVLFGVCVSAIVMIAEEMKTLKTDGPTLPFPSASLAQAIGTP